ncbi:MAG: transposase [Syntrophomonas sp.]
MPRQARQVSKTGIYHVIVRGINRQEIYHDDDDYERYLMTLHRIGRESQLEIMGYCLMSNHAHLLIKEGEVVVSHAMKRLGASYAYWYNLKYEHSGHVFQDRFKSENVEDDAYLITVIRYIHRNPIKAGIISRAEDYRWSSAKEYYGSKIEVENTKTKLILSLFADDTQVAKKNMRQHEMEENEDQCMEEVERKRMTLERAKKIINEKMRGKPIGNLHKLSTEERNEIIREIKGIEGISLRQVAMITGLTVYQVLKA